MKKIEIEELKKIDISFLIITANLHENGALFEYLKPINKYSDILSCHSAATGNTYYIGIFGKYVVAHMHITTQGSYDMGASFISVQKAKVELSYHATFVVGIAFGNDKHESRLSIGDVLLSSKILPYEKVKVIGGVNGEEIFQNRNKPIILNDKLVKCFSEITWRNNTNNKFVCGSILSGEKLIDDFGYREKLISMYDGEVIVGGEMEGTGAGVALQDMNDNNLLIIKAVCDWAYQKESNKEENQKLAAKNAMRFCYAVFSSKRLNNLYKRSKIVKSEFIYDIKINGYKMFYYRRLNRIRIPNLANKMLAKMGKQVSDKQKLEDLLRKLENVKMENDKEIFADTNYYYLSLIEECLNCNGQLSNLETNETIKFIYRNKEKHKQTPVTDVKAVVFDFDGTLTVKEDDKSSWERIWSYLDYDANIPASLYRKFKSKDITHAQWGDETIRFFKDKSLCKNNVIDLAKKTNLADGFIELMKELEKNEIKLYICSGSIDTIIYEVLGEAKKYFDIISCNKFIYDGKDNLSSHERTIYDFEGKTKFIEKICADNKIESSEIAFVGNSDNDLYAYKSGARTILINPHNVDPGDDIVWHYYIVNIKSLMDLLSFILPTKFLLK